MKKILTILLLTVSISRFAFAKSTNIYVILYATEKGKTGHVGIAIDNYHIVFHEVKVDENILQQADTLTTGELTYYDLWPNDDYFTASRTNKDIPGIYFKLPVSSNEEITLNSLYDKGIPHKEHYPSDGLLKINTSWKQDKNAIAFLDSMLDLKKAFNAQKFNCSDFVRIPLENILGIKLRSREFILVGWSTTPNKLYRNLRKIKSVEVIKNADLKASRSFIGQRIVYKIFHHTKSSS